MKHFRKIRFTILLLSAVLLNGCAKTPIDAAVDSAQNSVVALENSLKKECKTEGINSQITAIKTSINEIREQCITQIQIVQEQKAKWQILFFGGLAVIAFFLYRKFHI